MLKTSEIMSHSYWLSLGLPDDLIEQEQFQFHGHDIPVLRGWEKNVFFFLYY